MSQLDYIPWNEPLGLAALSVTGLTILSMSGYCIHLLKVVLKGSKQLQLKILILQALGILTLNFYILRNFFLENQLVNAMIYQGLFILTNIAFMLVVVDKLYLLVSIELVKKKIIRRYYIMLLMMSLICFPPFVLYNLVVYDHAEHLEWAVTMNKICLPAWFLFIICIEYFCNFNLVFGVARNALLEDRLQVSAKVRFMKLGGDLKDAILFKTKSHNENFRSHQDYLSVLRFVFTCIVLDLSFLGLFAIAYIGNSRSSRGLSLIMIAWCGFILHMFSASLFLLRLQEMHFKMDSHTSSLEQTRHERIQFSAEFSQSPVK